MKSKNAKRDCPIPTVGALVFNKKGECLLVLTHKWGGTYGIPGGKIEKGEKAVDALVREMREETGLKIKPGKLLLVQDSINSTEFHVSGAHFLLLNYLATSSSNKVRLNDEAVSFLWIRPRQALSLHLNEPTRVLIRHVLKMRRLMSRKILR